MIQAEDKKIMLSKKSIENSLKIAYSFI